MTTRPARTSWAFRFQVRQYIKGSLWVLPMLGGLLGPVLALSDLWLEGRIRLPDALTYTADSASGILTAIVGAMVGLLGFVVTIGVLVVQTATNTLSPRFMRLWYRDPLQKAVLATFAGTFTFAFTLLRRVTAENVPSLGVSAAGGLVTVSLLMLLVFLDRFTHALRPVAVGALMVRYGLGAMAMSVPGSSTPIAGGTAPGGVPDLVVRSSQAGVVQAVDVRGLMAIAQRYDCVLVLAGTPGEFIASGAPIVRVFSSGSLPDTRALAGLFALGIERTIDQDPAFALRILVDVAIRALSPAVNDPTTAIQMINHIEVFLEAVAATGHDSGTLTLGDRTGVPRVIIPTRQFDSYLGLAMTEILAYGGRSYQVCRRLSAMLASLADRVAPDDRPAVDAERVRLETTIAANFADAEARAFARTPDTQGIGGLGAPPAGTGTRGSAA